MISVAGVVRTSWNSNSMGYGVSVAEIYNELYTVYE
jgi:hypothetical protein